MMLPLKLRRQSPDQIHETGAAPIFAGSVIDLTEVVSLEHTVLDETICEQGGTIDLPFPCRDWADREIHQVYVPAFHHRVVGRFVQLHALAGPANLLLRTIEEYKHGVQSEKMVQGAVALYYRTALQLLGGKKGLLNTQILASRIRESGRAVLLPNADHHPRYVGIPQVIMTTLKLEEEDLVIVGRDPTIWHGGLEVLHARQASGNAMELHPLVFAQLGADSDGDEVYVYKVPSDPECQEEARGQVLGFTRVHAEWPAYLRERDASKTVAWEAVSDTGRDRIVPMGFSIGPEDILAQSEELQALCQRTGKSVEAECKQIAEGLDINTVKRYVEDQNRSQLAMKLGMGPVGAASNRLKVIAGTHRRFMESACYLSEGLQQRLLDSKHLVGTPGEGSYSVQDILDLLNRRGTFEHASLDDAMEVLGKAGMDLKRAWPILAYLWVVYPVGCAIQVLGEGLSQGRIQRMLAYVINYVDDQDGARMMSKVRMASSGQIQDERLYEEAEKFRIGLSGICAAHYPIFEMAQDACLQDMDRCAKIARRLLLHGDWDPHGVGKVSLGLVMKQEEGVHA